MTFCLTAIKEVNNRRSEVYTEEQKTKAWADAAGMVQRYSDDMISRWSTEIDTYLVFVCFSRLYTAHPLIIIQAGLFSAILTAFNVQSYLLLQPASPDPSVAILQRISLQLASFSINPPFVNSTQPSSTGFAIPPAPVSPWAVWLNALWFSGLVLSLASASIGIMVKQWLDECSSGVSGTSRPIARVRQYRLHNLRRWHMEEIVGTIPILLQLSLALFVSGLLILLWNLHHTVAAVVSVLAGLLAASTAVATLLPLYDHRCPYISPHFRTLHALRQSWLAFWVRSWMTRGHHILAGLLATLRRLLRMPGHLLYWIVSLLWSTMSTAARPTFSAAARQLSRIAVPPESWRAHKQTWKGREQSAIYMSAEVLDMQILVEAYNITLHPDALSAASVCLMDFDSPIEVVEYFQKLHKCAREHFGSAADSFYGPFAGGNQQRLLWLQIMVCLARSRTRATLSHDDEAALRDYFASGQWSSNMQAADMVWATSACSALWDCGLVVDIEIEVDYFITVWQNLVIKAMMHEVPATNTLLPGATVSPRGALCIELLLLLAIASAYRQVRVKQVLLMNASLDDAKDAHTDLLRTAVHFFAFLQPYTILLVNDLGTISAYMGDVLAELSRILLEVFAEDKTRMVIVADHMHDLAHALFILDADLVKECIPDEIVPDLLRLTDILSSASDCDYADNGNLLAHRIQSCAHWFARKLIHAKHKPWTLLVPPL